MRKQKIIIMNIRGYIGQNILVYILFSNFTFPLCLKRITFPQFNRITFPYIVTFQKQNSTKQDKLIILCYFSGKLSTFPCTKRLLEAPSCHQLLTCHLKIIFPSTPKPRRAETKLSWLKQRGSAHTNHAQVKLKASPARLTRTLVPE